MSFSVEAPWRFRRANLVAPIEAVVPPRVPSFEERLFEDGVLDLSPEFFEKNRALRNEHKFTWLRVFNKKIPASWEDTRGIWKLGGVVSAFRKAGEQKVNLSRNLKLAGVTHPHAGVVEEVIASQRLDHKLLTAAYMRGYCSINREIIPWWKENIVNSQRAKGVSEISLVTSYQDARELAK